MKFSYDLTQAEPVFKKLPVADGVTFYTGSAVQLTVTAGQNEIDLAATTWVNLAGVYYDAGATSSGTVAAGTSDYKKILVNPFAVYLTEYQNSTSACLTTTGFATKTYTLTHDGCAGDWIVSNGSAENDYEQFIYIASTSTTASMVALSTPTKTPETVATYMHVHANLKGRSAAIYGEIDLDSTGRYILTDATLTGTGFLLLDNQVTSPSRALMPLRRAQHDNKVIPDATVYGELQMVDNIYNAT